MALMSFSESPDLLTTVAMSDRRALESPTDAATCCIVVPALIETAAQSTMNGDRRYPKIYRRRAWQAVLKKS
jgi:hypothetical protein